MRRSTVLVLDGDDLVRASLAAFLREEGFAVREAADGKEAAAALTWLPDPAVMVADPWTCPPLPGWAAAREACRRRPTIGIVYASSAMGAAAARLPGGQECVLPKPFAPPLLARLVRELTGRPAWAQAAGDHVAGSAGPMTAGLPPGG